MVEVADDERQRRAERAPLPEAGEHLDRVGLELLARAAPVPELAAAQVGVDRGPVEQQPRGQAGEDGHERGTVGLTCGDEAESHDASLDASPEQAAACRGGRPDRLHLERIRDRERRADDLHARIAPQRFEHARIDLAGRKLCKAVEERLHP